MHFNSVSKYKYVKLVFHKILRFIKISNVPQSPTTLWVTSWKSFSRWLRARLETPSHIDVKRRTTADSLMAYYFKSHRTRVPLSLCASCFVMGMDSGTSERGMSVLAFATFQTNYVWCLFMFDKLLILRILKMFRFSIIFYISIITHLRDNLK